MASSAPRSSGAAPVQSVTPLFSCLTAKMRVMTVSSHFEGERPAKLRVSALRRDAVLSVGHVLHPVHVAAALGLVDREVDHAVVGGGAVPMLLARGNPDRVAGADHAHRPALGLHAADPG